MIKKLILKHGEEITIEKLTPEHIYEIYELQKIVIEELFYKSILEPLSKDEYLTMLNGKGLMIGAYHNEKLIAFRAMLEPELDEDHLGKDAGIPKSQWTSVLYSEVTNVNPQFRGNNLQVILGEILIAELDKNRFRYICATVAPFNIASLKDKFTHGFNIVSLTVKYGDLLRYILMKDLSSTLNNGKLLESRCILMVNTKDQQELLLNGWIGTGVEKSNGEWIVRFENRQNI